MKLIFIALVICLVILPVSAQNSFLTPDPSLATLVIYEGTCRVTPSETQTPITVTGNMELELEDKVESLGQSNIEIRYPDKTWFRLEENTTIEMDIEGFFLQKGGVWVKVEKSGTTFTVKTETLMAGVRGTEFTVETGDTKDTSVSVLGGEVAVSDREQEEWLPITRGQQIKGVRGKPVKEFKKEKFKPESQEKKWQKRWTGEWKQSKSLGNSDERKNRRQNIITRSRKEDQKSGLNKQQKIPLNPYRSNSTQLKPGTIKNDPFSRKNKTNIPMQFNPEQHLTPKKINLDQLQPEQKNKIIEKMNENKPQDNFRNRQFINRTRGNTQNQGKPLANFKTSQQNNNFSTNPENFQSEMPPEITTINPPDSPNSIPPEANKESNPPSTLPNKTILKRQEYIQQNRPSSTQTDRPTLKRPSFIQQSKPTFQQTKPSLIPPTFINQTSPTTTKPDLPLTAPPGAILNTTPPTGLP